MKEAIMNKIVKGSIAGAAGLALLLGGAGTFALWNTSTTVSAQTIKSFSLSPPSGHGVWPDGAGGAINPVTYKLNPGQPLPYPQPLTGNALGNGIKANLAWTGV